MFTGLIADCGRLRALRRTAAGGELIIETSLDVSSFVLGESVAVDGACLTVTQRIGADAFSVDASLETLSRSTIGERRPGDRLHLERALAVGDRLGGHFVLGHVDGVGTLRSRRQDGNAWLLEVEAPDTVAPYLLEKGSITVDGVSLTVNATRGERFSLAIIPFTSGETNLLTYEVGRRVNLEADVLGKYVRKFLQQGRAPGSISMQTLEESGFL